MKICSFISDHIRRLEMMKCKTLLSMIHSLLVVFFNQNYWPYWEKYKGKVKGEMALYLLVSLPIKALMMNMIRSTPLWVHQFGFPQHVKQVNKSISKSWPSTTRLFALNIVFFLLSDTCLYFTCLSHMDWYLEEAHFVCPVLSVNAQM